MSGYVLECRGGHVYTGAYKPVSGVIGRWVLSVRVLVAGAVGEWRWSAPYECWLRACGWHTRALMLECVLMAGAVGVHVLMVDAAWMLAGCVRLAPTGVDVDAHVGGRRRRCARATRDQHLKK